MAFHDHFSGHAAEYRAARPHYPQALFTYLANLAPGRQRAWDCGCGNGQAAVPLAEYFAEVVATDPSRPQLEQAEPHERVRYVQAPAETVPLPDGSVDLVTAAQALHWFNFDRFYAEVRRVLRPGGVVAVWAYGRCCVTPEIDAVVERLYEGLVGPYWPPERRWVEEGYRTIPFPFDEEPVPPVAMAHAWTRRQLEDYCSTWSATKRYQSAHGQDPVAQVRPDLARAWGPEDFVREVRWPLGLRVGRWDPASTDRTGRLGGSPPAW